MDFPAQIEAYRQRIEAALARALPPVASRPATLHAALHHAVQSGGKRLRPILLLAAADLYNRRVDPLPAAVAVELLHTYTLIHDDLPAMDDSPLRRGRPTVHVKFGEATAILAGDALLTEAFLHLAGSYVDQPAIARRLVEELARAGGSQRLIAGQWEDTAGESKVLSSEDLDFIHLNKTSALIEAALVMGLVLTDAPPQAYPTLRSLGRDLGLAFQIVDDLLDSTGDAATTGKPTGADAARAKNTYPAIHGLEASRQRVLELTRSVQERCESLPEGATFLRSLAADLAKRKS